MFLKKLKSPKFLRMFFLVLAVLLQGAIMVLPYLFLREYIAHLNWILEFVSLVVILYILKSDLNPVYKIPWIVVLMAFPVFGGVMYLVYGQYHFSKKEVQRFVNISLECEEEIFRRANANEELEQVAPEIYPQARYLLNQATAPTFINTETTYYSLADDLWPVMLQELKKAEKFIFMEYFIVEDGKMFGAILDILKEKVKAGVDVRFMYDSLGSITKTTHAFAKELRSEGIDCYEFNTFRSIMNNRYNSRDHRKICVIDGNVAFTGGTNLADEYINEKTVYGHWKDNGIMLKGDAVWGMTILFLSLWNSTHNVDENMEKYAPTISVKGNGYVCPYTDYPMDNETVGKNVYLNIINRAKKYVYIMTPYLILDNTLSSAMANAAKNGIDVRIMMPGVPDKKLVNMLSKSYYERLIDAGVKVYEYTPGFVHSKIFVSDDEVAVVGTINLDYRSLAHHFENAVWMYKTESVMEVKKDFTDNIPKCELITLEKAMKKSFSKVVFLPILRLFSPML